jgi:signal transduction histidine kinase
VQYVGDNVRFLQDGFTRLLDWSTRTETTLRDAAARGTLGDPACVVAEADAARCAADVDYLAAEIPLAIEQSLEGVQRIAEIVRGMKALSHPGAGDLGPVDLHAELDKTIAVARNEWKYVADVVTEYDPALPPVHCWVGELHQVFLNLLVNAAHAVSDALPGRGVARGTISVRTRVEGGHVVVEIQDTGTGIPDAIRTRVFDPFFTTKEVGKGTGQGLAIAHRAVEKHGGALTFETQLGVGTTFVVRLPLGGAPAMREAA